MFELTDHAFIRVQPLLPANSRRGRPWRDHRQVLGGIVWKLHTGRPWGGGMCPVRFGPWQTCYGRLRAGSEMGPGRGSGRCWPLATSWTHATVAPATQHLPHRGWRPPHQGDQQPLRLRGRDPDQIRAGWPSARR
jgi:transposase